MLTARDSERIARATKRDIKEFSIGLSGQFPYERKMKKLGGQCAFLIGSTCSVYKVRPLICRFYPFFLRRSRDGVFEIGFDAACSGVGKGRVLGEAFYQRLARLAKRELPTD